jgi:hypothetical protein
MSWSFWMSVFTVSPGWKFTRKRTRPEGASRTGAAI